MVAESARLPWVTCSIILPNPNGVASILCVPVASTPSGLLKFRNGFPG
jgi:hypothetical protein